MKNEAGWHFPFGSASRPANLTTPSSKLLLLGHRLGGFLLGGLGRLLDRLLGRLLGLGHRILLTWLDRLGARDGYERSPSERPGRGKP